ncbi:MAG: hypothetical protein EBU46_09750 [Nitrosomonadaceae bacterium]|nr:hypothetical protein [Nitrosomonadaceae bacterium]
MIRDLNKNYAGRTVDVCISGKLEPQTNGVQPLGLTFGRVSTKCAGVQKLLQRYTIMLLTAKGSQKDNPNFGTDLIPILLGGNLIDVGHLVHTFNLASWSVVKTLRDYQSKHPEQPADEQINTALLVDYKVQGSTVLFNVKIQTQAGDIIDFVLPVTTPD